MIARGLILLAGQLGECAGAHTRITCPAASSRISLLSSGISGFPGKAKRRPPRRYENGLGVIPLSFLLQAQVP